MSAQLNWVRVMAIAIVSGAILSLAIAAPVLLHATHEARERRAAEPRPAPAADADQREIVRAIIRESRYEGVPPPPPEDGEEPKSRETLSIVLLDSSVVFCPGQPTPDADGAPCTSSYREESITAMEFDAEIPRKLRKELVLANVSVTRIPDPDLATVLYQSGAAAKNLSAGPNFWRGFYDKYPGTAGVLEVSRAVLSSDGLHALIYVEHRCDGLCGTGTLHYLVRTGSTWRIAKSVGLWVS